jgi:hypothetical protein
MATGLVLLPIAAANAFETSQAVTATPITSVPFVISTSGNYYLPANLTFSVPAGAAILVNASEVYIDLNGRTLKGSAANSAVTTIGVLVNNQVDVTIQNGDIDGFGIGIYFAPNSTDVNAKNTASNLRLNGDLIGVLSLSGTSNWVKDSIIDGGSVGIFFDQDSGSRAENNILENQAATEALNVGIALLSGSSGGVVFDGNVVEKGTSPFGMLMSGTDKYRFDSFVGFPNNSPHAGGTDEGAGSL